MSVIVEEFWIFSKEGSPYVNFYENNGATQYNFRSGNSDIELFKKVTTVLNSQKQELSKIKIEFLEFDEFKFTVAPCLNNYLVMVFKSPLEVKNKQIRNLCNSICGIISSLYMVKDFREWDGDLNLFAEFKKKIDLYFKMSSL